MLNVGIVSLGAMGRTIARSVLATGNTIHWTSEGRSEQTVDEARKLHNAIEHLTLSKLFDSSNVVFCIGSKGAAVETISKAKENLYKGIYVEGNTLHGAESEMRIAKIAESANINYVEALFRGYPFGYDQGGGEDKRNLYLSGLWRSAKIVESIFSDGIWNVEFVAESAKSLNRTRFGRLF